MKQTVTNEKPILFGAPMVRAVLDGTKTQTRRVVKRPPDTDFGFDSWTFGDGHSGEGWYCHVGDYPDEGADGMWKCPYGKPGDRLWVRETFYCDDYRYPDGPRDELLRLMEYRADHECRNWEAGCPCNSEGRSHWRPSIHMPRWASRIDLEVTAVGVERVQDITAYDIEAEGCDAGGHVCTDRTCGCGGYDVGEFAELWDSINAKRGYGWESNPWVWVVEFERSDM